MLQPGARDEAEARPGSQSPAGEGHHSNSKVELVWDVLCKPEAGEGRHDEVQCHISALRRKKPEPSPWDREPCSLSVLTMVISPWSVS